MNDQIAIFEMGPRDGLQNEKTQIPTDQKIKLINLLSNSGLSKIEATSFVSPKWVPQLSDAAEVMAGIKRTPNVSYAVLAPNLRGFEAAVQANASEVAIFSSASEGFSQANINASIEESIERFIPILAAAKSQNIPVRGYVSCVIKCPFDGDVKPDQVAKVAKRLFDLGCYEISLGDTIGAGNPKTVASMLDAVCHQISPDKLAGHYHDTDNNALDNIEISIQKGLRVFDASVGGLGGCPYAPGAKGNVATEAVIEKVEALGFATGIDQELILRAARFAKEIAGHDL